MRKEIEMNVDTKNSTIGAFLLIGLILIFLVGLRGCNNQVNDAQSVSSIEAEQSLATPTQGKAGAAQESRAGLSETGWMFVKFTDEKSTIGGFVYSWGLFENTDGTQIKGMCSSPNSPDPAVGDLYHWDKKTDILVPDVDNDAGNKQRFWYPQQVSS